MIKRICKLCNVVEFIPRSNNHWYCDVCKSDGTYDKLIRNPCKTKIRENTTFNGNVYFNSKGEPIEHRLSRSSKELTRFWKEITELRSDDIRLLIRFKRRNNTINPIQKGFQLSMLNDAYKLARIREIENKEAYLYLPPHTCIVENVDEEHIERDFEPYLGNINETGSYISYIYNEGVEVIESVEEFFDSSNVVISSQVQFNLSNVYSGCTEGYRFSSNVFNNKEEEEI